MTTLPESLTTALATRASGYGVVCDGVLNVKTITDTRNNAAFNALYLAGFSVKFGRCPDPDCECMVRALAKVRPDWRVVAVNVEAGS